MQLYNHYRQNEEIQKSKQFLGEKKVFFLKMLHIKKFSKPTK